MQRENLILDQSGNVSKKNSVGLSGVRELRMKEVTPLYENTKHRNFQDSDNKRPALKTSHLSFTCQICL